MTIIIIIIRRTYYMNRRDLHNASTDERKEAMKSALFVDVVETLLENKSRDTLQPGEAHIVIETEATNDGLNTMISCVASLSSANKVSILLSLMRNLDFSPMEMMMLLLQAKDMMEDEPFGGSSRNPFAQ
jgi:hypothetical protein